MNLTRIFWPWAEIARLEKRAAFLASQRDDFRRIANRRLDRLTEAQAALADLKARAMFRDPATGRLVKRAA